MQEVVLSPLATWQTFYTIIGCGAAFGIDVRGGDLDRERAGARVSSANLNNRGLRNDTEINVATLDAELSRGLHLLLWAEHLELIGEESMLMVALQLGH